MSFGLETFTATGQSIFRYESGTKGIFVDDVVPGILGSYSSADATTRACTLSEGISSIAFSGSDYARGRINTHAFPHMQGVRGFEYMTAKRKSSMRVSVYESVALSESHTATYYVPTRTTAPTTATFITATPSTDDTGFQLGSGSDILLNSKYACYSILQQNNITTYSVDYRIGQNAGGAINVTTPQNLTFNRALVRPPLLFAANTSHPIAVFDYVRDGSGKYVGARIIRPPDLGQYSYPTDGVRQGTASIKVYEHLEDAPIPSHGVVVYRRDGALAYHSGGAPLILKDFSTVNIPVHVDAAGYYGGEGWATPTWPAVVSLPATGAWVLLSGHPLVGELVLPASIDYWYHYNMFLGTFVYKNGSTSYACLRSSVGARTYYYSGWIYLLNFLGADVTLISASVD